MQIIDLNRAPKEQWRPGVMTQMYVSARNGAAQLVSRTPHLRHPEVRAKRASKGDGIQIGYRRFGH